MLCDELKDEYNVFLTVDFFGNTVVPLLVATLNFPHQRSPDVASFLVNRVTLLEGDYCN